MLKPLAASVACISVLSACGDSDLIGQASAPRAGFAGVTDTALSAQVGTPSWHLDPAEIAAAERRVQAMIANRSVSSETAVQVALLNNRGLQARYAELGLSATDLWETALGPIPKAHVSVSGLAGNVARTLEATLINAVLDSATARPRSQVANMRFKQAQLLAAGETVALAIETRRAWIEAVAAFEAVGLIARTKDTADAASELASELGRTGAMTAGDQAREHAFTAQIAAELANARLEARLAKERLARLMGLPLGASSFYVPDALPRLPGQARTRNDIVRLALNNRVDLAVGRIELEAIAADYNLSGKTRMVNDITLVTGVEAEREDGETETKPVVEVEFEIPLYDTSKLKSRRGSLEYMRAANMLAEAAVNARSQARSAHLAVTGKHSVAKHWRDVILPLRDQIDAESLRSYNGMITSTFDLLSDARDGLEAKLGAAEAKRDYWLAETDVTAAIWGGPANFEGGAVNFGGGGGSGGEEGH